VHSYSALTRPFEGMAQLDKAVEDLAARFGATKRIWHTEQGSEADGVGYMASSQTEAQCAVNLLQSYLSALAAGAEKFQWFCAETSPTYGCGVFYENYVPRPRLVALNGLARLLKGRRVTGGITLGDGKVACVLMDGKAGAAAALWDLDDAMTVQPPAGMHLALADMLCNPTEGADARTPIVLEQGRPVYLLTAAPGVEQLAAALRKAEVSQCAPVDVAVTRAANGRLQLSLHSRSARNLDLRVTVAAPDLFTSAPAPVGIVDLGPGQTHALLLAPDKSPPAGTQVSVSVQVESGSYAILTATSQRMVRF
jgi:hypothetical protein